jgi:hypothetical protein
MYAVPVVADLNVSETRIKYTETVSVNLSKLNQLEVNNLLKDLKDAALAHALKAHNADVFVQPQISAENKGQTQIIIEIVGYPAVYKNFRSATPNDDWIINVTRENQQEDASKVQGLKLFGK